MAYSLSCYDIVPFTLTGKTDSVASITQNLKKSIVFFFGTGNVTSGLPEVQMPPFEIEVKNSTLDFPELIEHLGSSVIAIPLISILESIAVAKAFCKLYFDCRLRDFPCEMN